MAVVEMVREERSDDHKENIGMLINVINFN
jgi:hypothetical protein